MQLKYELVCNDLLFSVKTIKELTGNIDSKLHCAGQFSDMAHIQISPSIALLYNRQLNTRTIMPP